MTKLFGMIRKQDWMMFGIVISIYIIYNIGAYGNWNKECWLLLLLCLIGVRKDQTEQSWTRFFMYAIPVMALFWYFFYSGNGLWYEIANWLFEKNRHMFVWDQFMVSIPYNDGAWTRIIAFPWLDHVMVWIYNYGFVLSLWICLIRSFWTKSLKKMFTYALSGHVLQFPLILPFYNLILLREVWWVKGQPDLLQREFATQNDLLVSVQNCFPSMHTSISFAMLLLALREKDPIFKYLMVLYCSSIIFSTLYLQIHWVLDVVGGMIFAFLVVKLADLIIAKIPALLASMRAVPVQKDAVLAAQKKKA
ncbi:MAG TPA: phosphatase PAP2 family protein [Bacillota bacterium]|nr:phosphatase PAP2 family protein [Bacillota bacterium]